MSDHEFDHVGYEFDHLDELYERVGDLKPGQEIKVRRRGQIAQDAMKEVNSDPRFEDSSVFQYARNAGPWTLPDPTVFMIQRLSGPRLGYWERTISNDQGVEGTIRITQSDIRWKPAGEREFHSVRLEKLIEWITHSETGASKTRS